MNYLGITATKFADEIGVQRSGISHIISGRNQPSYDFIVKIMKRYPDFNLDWLILGQGTMLRSSLQAKTDDQKSLFNQVDKGNKEISSVKPLRNHNLTEKSKNTDVTYVTSFDQIVLFYPDGTFKSYFPADKE
jgi:plasmid maintenance system antidote protein VapI